MDLMNSIAGGFAGSWGVITKVSSVLMWVILAGVVIAVFLYVVKFKHPLTLVMETNGAASKIVKDRGYFDKKKNKFKALKNRNINFPIPESNQEYIIGRQTGYFAVVRNLSASFLTVSENPHFIPANYDMLDHLGNEFTNSWNILKPPMEFWDKYGNAILFLGGWGALIIVVILIMKRMDAIIALGNSAAQAQIAVNKQVIESLPIMFLWRIKKKW